MAYSQPFTATAEPAHTFLAGPNATNFVPGPWTGSP